ncbi:MAG: GlxA family transcriptional regulator [Novosphingobium sp.]|nr:GlxA family transcriptional regulator [Novosphingobium sp.]MCP5403236.1 GlxA family transcriptional regulator [Novosphingobium sp.]
MSQSDIPAAAAPAKIGLLLTDGFALMSYASVIEPFRAANRLAGMQHYSWTHISIAGGPVAASSGTSIATMAAMEGGHDYDRVFVFAADDPAAYRNRDCFAWLRRMARRGASLIGVSGGPYLLARAGLLDGYRATIHWEHAEALRHEFPGLAIEGGLYVIDRDRMTCAGGTAGMDLAVELIAEDLGAQLARQVAEWFIRTEPRPAGLSQRAGVEARYGTTNERLARMLSAMEGALEDPLPRGELAEQAGVSLRQLERLCMRHFGRTISETYLDMRLDHAAQLLRSTGLSVTDVGIACGFRSQSHFSRCYRARFGRPPSRSRSGAAA